MTGRQRLNAIINRRAADRLAWTVLVDDHSLGALPPALCGMAGLNLARHLGADILLLNGWGTGYDFISPLLQRGEGFQENTRTEEDRTVLELRSPAGCLTAVWRRGHPLKHFVESVDDLRIYREIWEASWFAAADDRPAWEALNHLVGEDGIVTRFWGPSTIPRLLELDFGIETFYYLLHDAPGEMHALIELMHERELRAFELLAQGPCDVVILVENTSTRYISPDLYRRYNGPHVRDFVDAIHAAGKTALIHMCGHVRGLLDQIRGTGLDGIHALTPPPTGDTPWELALDVLGEDTIIMGVLDPTVFVLGPVEKIGPALDRLYTPRVRRAPTVLIAGADGITVPLERFEAVAWWMERNGHLP